MKRQPRAGSLFRYRDSVRVVWKKFKEILIFQCNWCMDVGGIFLFSSLCFQQQCISFILSEGAESVKEEPLTLARSESPYIAHVFVCTNDRGGVRKSCADNDSALVKTRLKEAVNQRGWQGKVRISTSGCMGLCAQGANVMIYPQKIWLSAVTPEQVDPIVALLEELLAAHELG